MRSKKLVISLENLKKHTSLLKMIANFLVKPAQNMIFPNLTMNITPPNLVNSNMIKSFYKKKLTLKSKQCPIKLKKTLKP